MSLSDNLNNCKDAQLEALSKKLQIKLLAGCPRDIKNLNFF